MIWGGNLYWYYNNIIKKWKSSSIKFTKYQAIENRFDKNNNLILWEYATPIVYLSIKKKAVICEYFIWSIDSIISRFRQCENIMIDSIFHNPKNYEQLMIILFKDIISFKMLPAFFILMSHKNEILYDVIFKGITINNLKIL